MDESLADVDWALKEREMRRKQREEERERRAETGICGEVTDTPAAVR